MEKKIKKLDDKWFSDLDASIERLKEMKDQIQKELDRRAAFGMNPDVQNWAKFGTSMGFMMTLGFNVSSAFVNLSQLPMVVFPYLGGKYGYTKTMKAMGNASKVFAFSGRKRKQESKVTG